MALESLHGFEVKSLAKLDKEDDEQLIGTNDMRTLCNPMELFMPPLSKV